MYLFQKLNYNHIHLKDENDVEIIEREWGNQEEKPKICGFDTETTGLHYITSMPFLYVFGFNKTIITFEANKVLVNKMIELAHKTQRLFAHNAKYDYHMTANLIGEDVNKLDDIIADSMTVARLTSYADEDDKISLEALGSKYVDPNSKFAGKVIKKQIIDINAERKKKVKALYYSKGYKNFKEDWENFQNCVQYVDADTPMNAFFRENYKPANYYDVFLKEPELVINYAVDDVVIMLEYLKKALPLMCRVDEGLNTFNRECKLISAIARMENTGILVNVDYALESRERILAYREELYKELKESTGHDFSVGQHAYIKRLFESQYNYVLESADKKHLEGISKECGKPYEIARLIINLRTIDKWLSTYIDGKLNSIVNGRIYTNLNNSGAVSGRVSCDMQQQPKEPLLDRNGNELFHPRRMFVPDKDYLFVFADESQMELRVQAFYTMKTGNADKNLCRAYIPYDCTSCITDEKFNPSDENCLARWDSGEWLDENGNFWSPTDLHTLTTFTAFPFLNNDIHHPEFKHYRRLGKMCNFLKNYQGGIGAIMQQLDVPQDIAKSLDDAYYKNFPGVKGYQKWVENELTNYGRVKNLYGRAYFMRSPSNYYRACNYVIQGTCADLVKIAEIKVDELLKGKKSKFLLPIHDEFMCLIHKDEMDLIPKIKEIMQDTKVEIPLIPMISEVEYSEISWADKKEWKN